MRPSEIRDMTLSEAEQRLRDAEEELFNLRFQLAMRQLPTPSRVRQVRRDIARLKTILREHELGIRRLALTSGAVSPVG